MFNKFLKTLKWTVISITAIATLLILGLWIYDIYQRPQLVANILNIKSPPPSLEVIDCESPFTTDILTTCMINIAPDDFPKLLSGYQFEETVIQGTSYSEVFTKVGTEFPVSIHYRIEPKEFEHGGSVNIFTNSAKNMAIVDLYIE